MNQKPSKTLSTARIHWRDEQPTSSIFDDVYFSRACGIEETRHVFFQHNNLYQRWQNTDLEDFTLGETGFGTGLNFLAASQLWLEMRQQGRLHFISAEKFPLALPDLQKSLSIWPELTALAEELIAQYPHPIPGIHRLELAGGRIVLTLLYGDASEMFAALKGSDHPQFSRLGSPRVDAWFLDGFAPAKNPDMWTEALFQAIADLSDKGTTFSTFTAAGVVRRGMQAVGFSTAKVAGFGRKRDMLCGEMKQRPQESFDETSRQPASFNSPHQPPWYLQPKLEKPTSAIVIGGGIAGCSSARALAERGISVTLIERHQQVAREASGNPQGILYPKLSTQSSTLSRFGLMALCHALRFHRHHLQTCGLLQLPQNDREAASFPTIADQHPENLVQLIGKEQLDEVAGIALAADNALYFPSLGWISPADVCKSLIEHPNIKRLSTEVASLNHSAGQYWQALASDGSLIAQTPLMIIACASNSARFAQTAHLPLKSIRGQISVLPATAESSALKTVICGKGYLAPAANGQHTLGATYDLGSTSTEVVCDDHQKNLQQLSDTDARLGCLFDDVEREKLHGRAALRCTTPDYLPIAGPAPIMESYLQDFALLRKNARSHIPTPGKHWPGLYLNCGHGSRGMSYAPLCAELIASEICAEAPPLELALRQAIHPGRFIIRDLKRDKG